MSNKLTEHQMFDLRSAYSKYIEGLGREWLRENIGNRPYFKETLELEKLLQNAKKIIIET